MRRRVSPSRAAPTFWVDTLHASLSTIGLFSGGGGGEEELDSRWLLLPAVFLLLFPTDTPCTLNRWYVSPFCDTPSGGSPLDEYGFHAPEVP
ncbi:hypothetical protein TNCV_3513431 [Trichonephila clavipes]|nr:hypothetical protein TNCV_3513431 [Trichonephila clavipes]